nr:glycogen-debranching protein [Acidimicrobiia bacterium]
GTYRAFVDQLPRLDALGVTAIELLPVHQTDPQEGSYWGYMPLCFGAVHAQYAAGDDPAAELAALVAAAHELDIEVWLDVVVNHTTEVDAAGPTYHLRGLDDAMYRRRGDGSYIETTGCGNDVDADHPAAQDLVVWSLDRLADLGVDGFRFDLAAVLSRSPSMMSRLEAWARTRDVRTIAEAWDAAGGYQVGRTWPGTGWMQWNDRFRNDVRSFLRADDGSAALMEQRVQGSPDLFDAPGDSINYLSCHDGFTLYDVFAYDAKHNGANGHGNRDGADDNRSWNCGWEGDDGAPDTVLALRRRQLRNAWCLLAMSHGVPMVAAGDEHGRTQGGNNNAYNQDNATSWIDYARRDEFADLEHFVTGLLALRARHAVLTQPEWWGDALTFLDRRGVDGSTAGPSIGWSVGDLCVLANAWWHPTEFALPPGSWTMAVDTNQADLLDPPTPVDASAYVVGPRSAVILTR